MKVRMDFVTNSSSSSFIIARKPEWNEKQKKAILQYVEEKLLGEKLLEPGDSEEKIQEALDDEWAYYSDEEKQKIRNALTDGETVYSGTVSFEECDWNYAEMYEDLWNILEQKSDGDFEIIDGDLSY